MRCVNVADCPHVAQGSSATDPATVRRRILESLGVPPVREPPRTVLMEGHVNEFPLWSFSKQRSTLTALRIDYGEGDYALIDAPKGFPSPGSPGYLDVLLYWGQRDLFDTHYVEMSAYSILRQLEMDPTQGMNYRHFVRDMERHFALMVKTNRLRHPDMGPGKYTTYFRVLDSMILAKNRRGVSRFYFNEFFVHSLRDGYLKRLDFDFCLALDRQGKALARFLYGHLRKRLGAKAEYKRTVPGLLTDLGLGHLTQLPRMRQNEHWKRTIAPALDLVKGHAFDRYEVGDNDVVWFLPLPE